MELRTKHTKIRDNCIIRTSETQQAKMKLRFIYPLSIVIKQTPNVVA